MSAVTSAAMSDAMSLDVRGLSIAARAAGGRTVPLVTDVSFRIAPGEAFGLVGESGSGKSMTALAALGLLRRGVAVTAGSVRLGGTELAGPGRAMPAGVRGRRIAMVFQDPMAGLNPAMRVGEQIAEVLRHHLRMGRAAAARRAADLLGEVGIEAPARRARDYPHTFSGGMRQRVMIAMALACEPAVLIADEPTTALDVTVQAQILDLLVRMQDERGMALLLVTHDLGVVAGTCHRLAVMYAGRLVEEGPVGEVFDAPRHPYTAALLAAAPENAMRGTAPKAIPGTVPAPGAYPPGCAFGPRCAHARPGPCDTGPVAMTESDGRRVRCARAPELALPGVPR
ncbi:oligopeptide/dipeptide ABC transporter ATP-binding protein [Thermocatellispora tengchongensis]|uniref:Oligopeptide/dipeptide ABC transporter ATP-binding protein n=1 Tax=Thermocatellispora tengchongensis TaxID=1073253 RepID=A0A840PRE0_9ACTN|nr:ABC transporter ATP-binding protein [Thermocatellispora tengchongensis]MBB5138535.1 oligopeptide/dipeptide ABC transporter ATP-binding protein [Thermocatellispora tengchongensis]